mmetsp:Transcript_611/g.1738  ORF Transcript_611/g.1738 Transcript_611/m.1738 type:complete len:211 (-) Transcript_611:1242-1874(-)
MRAHTTQPAESSNGHPACKKPGAASCAADRASRAPPTGGAKTSQSERVQARRPCTRPWLECGVTSAAMEASAGVTRNAARRGRMATRASASVSTAPSAATARAFARRPRRSVARRERTLAASAAPRVRDTVARSPTSARKEADSASEQWSTPRRYWGTSARSVCSQSWLRRLTAMRMPRAPRRPWPWRTLAPTLVSLTRRGGPGAAACSE